MRFHHSTRRGRNRFSQASSGQTPASSRFSGNPNSRWSQLGYCRETNIHFNRRLPVECPEQFGVSLDDHEHDNHLVEPVGAQLGSFLPLSCNQPLATNQNDHHQTSQHHHHRRQHNQHPQRTALASQKAIQQDSLSQLTANIQIQQCNTRNRTTQIESNVINQQGGQQEANKLRRSEHQGEQRADGSSGSLESQASSDDIDGIRQRLVAQVAKHHFWSRKAAKRMHFTHLETRQIYIYELLSYCERRDLEWRYEPFRGGVIGLAGVALSGRKDSPPEAALLSSTRPSSLTVPSGRALETASVQQVAAASSCHLQSLPESDVVWSIEPPAKARPEPFTGSVHSAELPGSSFVKRCHGCQGRGRLKCNSCHGVGYEVCLSCSGRGLTSRGSSALASSRRLAADTESPSAFYGDSRLSDQPSGKSDSAPGQGSPFSSRSRGAGEPGGICSNTDGQQSSGGWLTESCAFCHGAGQKRCWVCAGRSYNSCLGCQGSGQLRCFLSLNITWLNHRDESVINNTDNIIPRERLRLSSGLVLVDETAERLNPLASRTCRTVQAKDTPGEPGVNLPTPEAVAVMASQEATDHDKPLGQVVLDASQLHQASKRLLQRHASAYRHQRLIRQRHKVTQVECQVVSYEWKQRRGHFVIYGLERKVYIAKYPFKSICSIT